MRYRDLSRFSIRVKQELKVLRSIIRLWGVEFQSAQSHVGRWIDVCLLVLVEPDKSPSPKLARMLLCKFGKLAVVDASFAWSVEDEQVRYQVPKIDQAGSFNAEVIH